MAVKDVGFMISENRNEGTNPVRQQLAVGPYRSMVISR